MGTPASLHNIHLTAHPRLALREVVWERDGRWNPLVAPEACCRQGAEWHPRAMPPIPIHPLPPELRRHHDHARRVFSRAIRLGHLKQRTHCQRCHRKGIGDPRTITGVSAHHANYSSPLRVEWLCHWCHTEANAEMRDRLRLGIPV